MGSEGKRDTISYSRLIGYVCPAHGYYSYERRLQKVGGTGVFLVAGKAGHDALDTFYRVGTEEAALLTLNQTWLTEGGNAFDLSGETLNLAHMEKVLRGYINDMERAGREPGAQGQ